MLMKKAKLIISALFALLAMTVSAQNVKISGVVIDASTGEGIPFAAVMVDGTSQGVSADVDGSYTISAPANAVLVYSAVGYSDVKESVNGRTSIDVRLELDNELLDETIVVAYGTATKSSFTGSAAMVKSEEISKKITTNVTSALAGTTPGVQVISSSGDPTGNASSIRIRGIGSMSASTAPLIIVDGAPYDGSISSINPNDVESMSVLKDAAASAIYGHRGANGVILITTKKGQSGDATVKLDARFGSNSRLIPNYDVISDPAEYYEAHYTRLYNKYFYAGHSAAESYAFADKNLLDEKNGGLGYLVYTIPAGEKLIGTNFKLNPNAKLGYDDGTYYYIPDDWYNETFHNSFRQEYNISVSGASNRFNYYASAGILDDGGIIANSGFKRYTARVNADYQVKKWFKVNTNLSYTHTTSQSNGSNGNWGSSGNVFYLANNIGPIYPLYVRASGTHEIMTNTVGKVFDSNNTNFIRPNFVGNAIRDNLYDSTKWSKDVLNGKIGAVLTPVKGLTLSANVSFMASNTRENDLSSIFGGGASTNGAAYVYAGRDFSINQQYLAEYKKEFGKNNIDVLAGYEIYNYETSELWGQNDHLFNPLVGELNNADGSESKQLGSQTNYYMTQGFLARAQYDYAGKYFASVSYRRDASSRFAPGKRWGNFYSVGGAWLISKEDFMSSASWVDMLKFKASYGEQGNDALSVGSYYPYADAYSHSYNPVTGEYSIQLVYKGNEDITWEKKKSFNVGFDFELFGGYLNGSVEYFNQKTDDLLYSKNVPLSSGNPTGKIPVNVGNIRNEGFEIVLDGSIIKTKNVNWTWNANFSHYKNTILSLDESVAESGIKGSYYIYKVGGSLYDGYMYKYAGVDPANGQALYWQHVTKKDDNGNIVSEEDVKTPVFSDATQYEIGSILPKLYGGFGTSLNAYGFDFSVQLSYQLGGKFYDGSYQQLMHTQNNAGQAWHVDALKAWTPTNTDTDVPRMDGDTQVAQSAVDRFLASSNYLSVNNVTLGYTLPAKWSNAIKLGSIRIYVAGENLAVLSARKGLDPRFSMGLGSYTSGSGIGTSSYSAMRTVTGGITVTF